MSMIERTLVVCAAVSLLAANSAFAMPEDPFYSCESDFITNIGPPTMAQPNGSFQTVSRDCTGNIGCNDYFDITMQAGDELILSLCSDGGSVSFDSDLTVWSGPTFEEFEMCNGISCGSSDGLDFIASDTGTYRVRIGQNGLMFNLPFMLGGPYVLAYSAPVTSTIVPAACGNGTLDAGEDCDDDNDIGGDCCSATCQFEASASSCPDDANDCTVDQCDGAGTCLHPNASAGTSCTPDGEFCTTDTCDGAGTCTHPTVPDCNQEPPCGATQPPSGFATFEHPKQASKIVMSLVQAFVGCNNAGGNSVNTTTEGGVPACAGPETYNEQDGSPSSGWRWNSANSRGDLTISQRCTGAGDFGIKLSISGIVDGTGAPANATGTLVMAVGLTLHDPSGGDMTTITIPMSYPFSVASGSAKLLTSANAFFSEQQLPPLPNGVSVEFRGLEVFDAPFLEIRDANGNAFARPGVFLP